MESSTVEIQLCRTNYIDLDTVYELYKEARTRDWCPWRSMDNYPSKDTIGNDILKGNHFIAKLMDGTIVGALAIEYDSTTAALPCWNPDWHNPVEISRLVVREDYRGHHIAASMIRMLLPMLKYRGYDTVRFLVVEQHERARKAYDVLGFTLCGQGFIYGHDYLYYERTLEDCNPVKQKLYETEELEVLWQPELCFHSKFCIYGSCNAFDPHRRPWIRPDAEPAEKLYEIVNRCPSGGLTARLKHGSTDPNQT